MVEESKAKASKKTKKESEEKQSVEGSVRNVIDELSDLVGKNQVDASAVVVLLAGLLIFNWHALIGGVIVGIVVGLYFSTEALQAVSNINEHIDEFGPFKSHIGLIGLVFLVWASPYMFVGLASTLAFCGF